MWRKWVFIASLGALTCLFRGTVGEVAAAPGGSGVGPAILSGAASAAAAAGHPLPQSDRDQVKFKVNIPNGRWCMHPEPVPADRAGRGSRRGRP